jgi:hypothetical protein
VPGEEEALSRRPSKEAVVISPVYNFPESTLKVGVKGISVEGRHFGISRASPSI